MAKTTIENYTGIGEVVFASSRRSKRLSISVAAYKPVRVSFPPRVSLKTAKEYLQKNAHWVQKSQLRAKEREVKIEQAYRNLPQIDIETEANRIHQRLQQLASAFGYCFGRVSFRNQKTRWGSCSSQNNISLNINLAHLPRHLCDYVLLHELAHTRVKNHGKDFWKELDRTTFNKARQLDKELNQYTIPQNRQ
ncbi:MAG: M48 family metallopeptidase [Sedimentisphaeraceae bacterium JB056]